MDQKILEFYLVFELSPERDHIEISSNSDGIQDTFINI